MQTGTDACNYITLAEIKDNIVFKCLCTGLYGKVGGVWDFIVV